MQFVAIDPKTGAECVLSGRRAVVLSKGVESGVV